MFLMHVTDVPEAPTMNTPRILVILAHPNLAQSRINKAMADAVGDLPGVTVHDLYAAYPDGRIDVAREQSLLDAHDIVVFQHPLFWYSSPALLKEWQDKVITYGYAYGPGGDALVGKTFFSAVSSGGPREAYQAGGHNNFSIGELLRPFQQMADFVRMKFAPAFVFNGALSTTDEAVARHAADWRQHLQRLASPAEAARAA